MKKKDVEEDIMKEILQSCNLYERIILKIFDKEFVKAYNVARINVMNEILKK